MALKDSCQSSCQDATVQRSGDYPQVPGSGLQNLVEHFAGQEAAQAYEMLSSRDWECLFKVRLQQVDFFMYLRQEIFPSSFCQED